MKIDLHCHTKRVKTGDGIGRNVTPELFESKVRDADVKIIAITNHNNFDLEQYNILKLAVADVCQVWPGVEIDIKGSNKRWHLIVVANPDKADDFNVKVEGLFKGKDLEKVTLNLSEVYECLNCCDVIYISHFHKKPAISEEEREELLSLVKDKSRVFNETPDHRSLGVFANYDYSVLIGSDVSDWSKYEKSTFAELRLPVKSFSQFCLLAKRDQVVVNTLLNEKKSYTVLAHPHKTVSIPLTIFGDVNIIFGQKGTGKTEILESIYTEMNSLGLHCEIYTGSGRDNNFKDLLKTGSMERDIFKLGANGCEADFKFVSMWNDVTPTLFESYCNWLRTRNYSTHKSKMKITDSTILTEPRPKEYYTHKKDKEKITDITNKITEIDSRFYLEDDESRNLTILIEKLKNNIFVELTNDVLKVQSQELTNYSINKIKSIADKNTDTVSKPSSTGFREFAQNRLRLRRCIENILTNINLPERNEQVILGSLEEKGKIYINEKYRMLNANSKTEEFEIGIRILKSIYTDLLTIKDGIVNADIIQTVKDLVEECKYNNIESVKPFLGCSKQIVTEDKSEYSPSTGEKGMLLLQQILEKEADAYFLDEPELGMGNSYIDMNIRPIISSLAKRHKMVVVATHNANIAVRTLPYMSIFRTHKNGEYNTYVGNPFDDRLENIIDKKDIKSWTTESLHTLEGGKIAFYERKNIYESKND